MKKNALRANRKRMKEEFEHQSKIGQLGKTGLSRVAFTAPFTKVRKYVKNAPILALTATATKQVIDDIQNNLQFSNNNIFKNTTFV